MPQSQKTTIRSQHLKWANKLFSNVLFQLKGVHINEEQCDMTDISNQQLSAIPPEANHADSEITTIHIPLLCCCATSF